MLWFYKLFSLTHLIIKRNLQNTSDEQLVPIRLNTSNVKVDEITLKIKQSWIFAKIFK